MAYFPCDTTHYRNWILSLKELELQKLRVHEEAEQRVLQKQVETGFQSKGLQFPSLEDAEKLVSYFVAQLVFVCSEKRLEYRVASTAAAFLSRFFLRRSVIEYDPRKILLTCILLAVKVEEASSLSLKHFCDGLIPTKERLADVMNNELVVLDALQFDLVILNARAPIHYLTTHYYQQHRTGGESDIALGKQLADLNRQSEQLALKAYTDSAINFRFTPSQIAVACFLQISGGALRDAEQFINTLFSANLEPGQHAAIAAVMQEVRCRLVLLVERDQQESEKERAQKALKTLKQIEKTLKVSSKKSPQGGGKVTKRLRRSDAAAQEILDESTTVDETEPPKKIPRSELTGGSSPTAVNSLTETNNPLSEHYTEVQM